MEMSTTFDGLFVIPGQTLPTRAVTITLESFSEPGWSVFMEATVSPGGLSVLREWASDDADQEVRWHVPPTQIHEFLNLFAEHPTNTGELLTWATATSKNADALRATLNVMEPSVVTFVWQH